jgi:hypothetical protein
MIDTYFHCEGLSVLGKSGADGKWKLVNTTNTSKYSQELDKRNVRALFTAVKRLALFFLLLKTDFEMITQCQLISIQMGDHIKIRLTQFLCQGFSSLSQVFSHKYFTMPVFNN